MSYNIQEYQLKWSLNAHSISSSTLIGKKYLLLKEKLKHFEFTQYCTTKQSGKIEGTMIFNS
jgi:hypothetical protein